MQNNSFEQGAVPVTNGNIVFKTARKLYIKELSTLELHEPALGLLSKEGRLVAALATYGKGRVIAIGDPWLYNEYVDGRKLPPEFDNYAAARDLILWLAKNGKQ